MPMYFDHAATTPVCPAAAAAAMAAMQEGFGNPSSRYRLGREAATALSTQRQQIAAVLGALPEELCFTSGGTEADNWALYMTARLQRNVGRHIITTAVEHAAVLEPLRALEQEGFSVSYVQPDKTGHIAVEQVASALRTDSILVSMMLLNNESGARFPIRETAALLRARKSSALLHSDAVQAFLKVPFTVGDLGVDLLSLSAHKIGGLKGCGALYIKKGLRLPPLLLGGGQEQGLRSGTEATPQIAAFAAACHAQSMDFDAKYQTLVELKAYALRTLQAQIPSLLVISQGDAPHICAISLPGYPSEMLVRALSDLDIFVSSGSACHKGKASHVFAAMKLPPKVLQGSLRLSFSPENTKEEIDTLCQALLDITRTRIAARS